MCFKVIRSINQIVLMYARILVQPPHRVFRFINEIKKYISCYMLLLEFFASVINAKIMIVPYSDDLCSQILHFLVIWIVFLRLPVLFLDILLWLHSCFFIGQERGEFVRVCYVTTPNKKVRRVFWIAYCFENVCAVVWLAVAWAPSQFYFVTLVTLWD